MNTIIHNSEISAAINHRGAELVSLKSKENKEYIWDGNPEFWGKHSPVLFPIVGTLKNNTYTYNKKTYSLPRHGFARDLDFENIEKSENSAIFSLISTEETRKIYPFDFEFQMIYTLITKELKIEYKIINKGNTDMPFSIGAHPAFALPNDFEQYSLEFVHQETLRSYQLKNDLLSDDTIEINLDKKKLPLTYSLFEKDALIFKELKSKKISILENDKPLLAIQFESFNNLGIWTKNNAPFVCIEPWLGYSDTVNSTGNLLEKEGIQILKAHKTFHCHFSITIS